MVAGTSRRQIQCRFNLDLNKEDEHQLHEMIRSLKKKRSFMGVIRDGIHLILDLRQGQTDVLRELFPWVFEQAVLINDGASSEGALQRQLEELKLLISQNRTLSATSLSPAIESEDDWMTVEISGKTSSEDYNPTWNFHIHSARLVTGSYSQLAPEIIWYGIRTGLIDVEATLKSGLLTRQQIADGVKARKVDPARLPKSVAVEIERLPDNGGPKKIAGANIGLSEPVFDDVELDF